VTAENAGAILFPANVFHFPPATVFLSFALSPRQSAVAWKVAAQAQILFIFLHLYLYERPINFASFRYFARFSRYYTHSVLFCGFYTPLGRPWRNFPTDPPRLFVRAADADTTHSPQERSREGLFGIQIKNFPCEKPCAVRAFFYRSGVVSILLL
jgi:hypothetical protein